MNDPLRYLIAEVRECERSTASPMVASTTASGWRIDLTFAEHMPWCMRYPKIPAGCPGCNRDGTRTVVTGIEVERAGTAIWDEGYWKEVEAPDA